MKKLKYRIMPLVLALFAVAGCIEDHGNYDYVTDYTVNPAVTFGIVAPSTTINSVVGDAIEFESKVQINDPALTTDQLAYEWYFGGELVSTGPTVRITDAPMATGYGLQLLIVDTRYDITYTATNNIKIDDVTVYASLTVNVTSPYTNGYAVLSNDGGKSKLGYIRYNGNGDWMDFQSDIYPQWNGGEELGGEPVNITHHMYATSPFTYALQINQVGGIGPVDVLTTSMQRIGLIEQEFVGGYPAGMKVKDLTYNQQVFLISDAGDVYVRSERRQANPGVNNHTIYAPHATRFPDQPMYIEGGAKITRWLNPHYLVTAGYARRVVAFDELNSRLLTFNSQTTEVNVMNQYIQGANEAVKPGDPGTDGTNTFPELAFPAPEDLTGYDVAVLGYYNSRFNAADNYGCNFTVTLVLERKSDGKYFMYQFDWTDPASLAADINLKKFYEFPVQNLDDDIRYAMYAGGLPYMFFTSAGNTNLYLMNLATGDCKLFYTSSSPITAIQAGVVNDSYIQGGNETNVNIGVYYKQLVVGKQDGTIVVLDTSVDAIAGTTSVLKEYDTQSGPVVDIAYMPAIGGKMTSLSKRW